MGKILLSFIVGIFLVLSIISPVLAEDSYDTTLHIFYGKGCPHCGAALIFLNSLKEEHPLLKVEMHETYSDQSERELFEKMTAAFRENIEGVPTTFVDNRIVVGFSDSLASSIEDGVVNCLENGCDDPINRIKDDETVKVVGDKTTAFHRLTIPAVISAAIVDAINPCAFAVLIILMSTVLMSKDRKKSLLAGLAFSLSIFISYFLMGLGLYSAIQATGLSHKFYLIVAILAIIIGLFNLKDYLWYGKWFVMEVPMKWRPKLKSLIGGVTSVPGAFLIGFVISLFLLPCTSGPYIVILGLLAESTTKSYAMILLVFYNLIFIMPMILITLALFFGLTDTKKAEKLRQKKLRFLHLIAGIIILCLGVGMLIALKLGMI